MADRYWVGNGGDWTPNGTAHWSIISGGVGGASAPTSSDNVFFDENSFTLPNQIVNLVDNQIYSDIECKDFNCSGVTNNPTIHLDYGEDGLNSYGSITLNSNMTIDMWAWRLLLTGDCTFYSDGVTLNTTMSFARNGVCSLSLLDDFINLSGTDFVATIFNTNGYNITGGSLGIGGEIVNLSTSVITLMAKIGGSMDFSGAINGDDAKVYLNFNLAISPGTHPPRSGSLSFYDVTGKIGYVEISDGTSILISSYFSEKIIDEFVINKAPITLTFVGAPSEFIVGIFTANGSPGNMITIDKFGSYKSLLSADVANVSYVDVKDNTAGGAGIPFDDSNGGVDSGGNTNWIFGPTILSRPIYFPQV